MKTRLGRARLLFAVALSLRAACAVEIDPGQYLEHIRFLASEEMKGRGTGTPELERAADYLAAQFRGFGLGPGNGQSYFQSFPVTTHAQLGKDNQLVWRNGRRQALKFNSDFRPLNFSESGTVSGKVVFAGYGITAPEYDYDDYAGIDVRNKIVLLLRHEPQEFDEKSVFGGRVYTIHAQFETKALNAKSHGARGVIFINDRPNHPSEGDDLEQFAGALGPASPGIPFVQVKAEVAEAWLARAGRPLADAVKAIDKDLRPQPFALPDSFEVEMRVDIERETRMVRNVMAYLPGQTGEYLIIGAHYDHIGLGEQYSMASSEAGKKPHPGADDNASGTAGVLELARWFSKQPRGRRGILFVTFAAEEIGLLGSSYFTSNPPRPLGNAVAMINLDMIGRPREGKVYVGGVGTGTTFGSIVSGMNGNGASKLNIDTTTADGYGSSDHFSFTPKQIPVLFFFSGMHGDYHRPSDTWDKIDAPAAAELLEYAGRVAEQLLAAPDRPRFVGVAHASGY